MGSENIVNKVEALLFSMGKRVGVEELAHLCKVSVEDAKVALSELKDKYKDHETIHVVEDDDFWKMTIREDYLPLVQGIVTDTELDKQTIETLAVIAFKNPALQADVIKIRTNKAYDHMRTLEERGYVVREKCGRTMSIKLTPKFFEYFDLPSDKMKEMFNSFHEVEKAIDAKEQELKVLDKSVEDVEEQDRLDRERQRESKESFDDKISNVEDEYGLEDVGPEEVEGLDGEEEVVKEDVAGETEDKKEVSKEVKKEVVPDEVKDGVTDTEDEVKEDDESANKDSVVEESDAVEDESDVEDNQETQSVSGELEEDVADDEDVSGDVSEVQESDEVSDSESVKKD